MTTLNRPSSITVGGLNFKLVRGGTTDRHGERPNQKYFFRTDLQPSFTINPTIVPDFYVSDDLREVPHVHSWVAKRLLEHGKETPHFKGLHALESERSRLFNFFYRSTINVAYL